MKTHCIYSLIATILATHPILAVTTTVMLSPSEDYRETENGLFFHDTSILSVYNDGGSNVQNSILQFDFTTIPIGAAIVSAELTLITYPWSYSQPIGTQSNIFAIATQPDNSTSMFGIPVTGPAFATNSQTFTNANWAPVSWNVTNLVAVWCSGTLPNYGMQISGTVGDQLHFFSSTLTGPYSNPSDSVYQPQLAVTYTIPEPSALLLGGVAILGGLIQRKRRQSALDEIPAYNTEPRILLPEE